MNSERRVLLHGKTGPPTGFSLINRRLIRGLRAHGFRVSVCSMDDPAAPVPPAVVPDFYLFHGDPFDFANRPGRVNAFFLQWEYRVLPAGWVKRLNRGFDLVLVPSRFSARVARRSGVRVPIRVIPGGFDPGRFRPDRRPARLPTRARFRFLHLGGAHDRRGTDVLLRAYSEEFTAADDVALVLKTFHYEHHRAWLQEVLDRCAVGRPGAPEVLVLHEYAPSPAPYFTACDVGVFPLRAECLGLPVLECLASGRPVIATAGTGLDQFCTRSNTRFLRARPAVRDGRAQLEPDVAHLRALLREAVRRGPLAPGERAAVAASVASFTWERALRRLAAALEEAGRAADGADRRARRSSRRPAAVRAAAGAALETFVRARRRDPGVRCIRVGAAAPLEVAVAATNAERLRCGLAPLRPTAMAIYRDRTERRLATVLLVDLPAAARAFVAGGDSARRVVVRPPPSAAAGGVGANPATRRFLFHAEEPFRGGIRLLLEAWSRVNPNGAELVCLCDRGFLESPPLLRLVLRHPTIRLGAGRAAALRRELARSHCLIVPTPYAAGPLRAGLAAGMRAVVAADCGAETLAAPRAALTFAPGSVAALASALRRAMRG